jgi:hypothetical protein
MTQQMGSPAAQTRDVSGYQCSTGDGTIVTNVLVQQQGLSHEELCKKLSENPATSDRKKTNGESAYERNKQRQLNDC